jgi:hypothetical protein
MLLYYLGVERNKPARAGSKKGESKMIKFDERDSAFMTDGEVSIAMLNEIELLLNSVQNRSNPEQLEYMRDRVSSTLYRLSESGQEEANTIKNDAEQAAGEARYRQSVLGEEAF